MSGNGRLPVANAPSDLSIWQDIGLDRFRSRVVALEKESREVPSDTKVHTENEWRSLSGRADGAAHVLPFRVEQQLADDFAFLAAAEEGVTAVSAVGLEEQVQAVAVSKLIVRLAANDSIPHAVPGVFESIFTLLGQCAQRGIRNKSSPSQYGLCSYLQQLYLALPAKKSSLDLSSS